MIVEIAVNVPVTPSGATLTRAEYVLRSNKTHFLIVRCKIKILVIYIGVITVYIIKKILSTFTFFHKCISPIENEKRRQYDLNAQVQKEKKCIYIKKHAWKTAIHVLRYKVMSIAWIPWNSLSIVCSEIQSSRRGSVSFAIRTALVQRDASSYSWPILGKIKYVEMIWGCTDLKVRR